MKEDKLCDLGLGENNNNNNNNKVDPTLWTEFIYRIMTCSARLFMKMLLDIFRRGGNFFISLAAIISNIVTVDRFQCSDSYMYHLLRHLKALHYANVILYVSIWSLKFLFFPMALQPFFGPGPPHYRGFAFTFRHATLGRIPLEEWSARRRDLYLTTHNTHKRQTSMPAAGFECAIQASERLQTCAATGIGWFSQYRTTISLYNFHRMAFIMEHNVFSARY